MQSALHSKFKKPCWPQIRPSKSKRLSSIPKKCTSLLMSEEQTKPSLPQQASQTIRLTPLRRRVLDIVCAGTQPVGAYDILHALRPLDDAATAAGVYRSLEFLTKNGMIHRLESTKAFVACTVSHHSHGSQFIVCHSCGQAVETNDPSLNKAAHALANSVGFSLTPGTMEISGLCRSCTQ